jgi:hypothetical protein
MNGHACLNEEISQLYGEDFNYFLVTSFRKDVYLKTGPSWWAERRFLQVVSSFTRPLSSSWLINWLISCRL